MNTSASEGRKPDGGFGDAPHRPAPPGQGQDARAARGRDAHAAYAPLPRRRGIFVTGTDTGVGKTLIAGAIARSLRRLGRDVDVFKPVASGCRRGREGLISADAEFLAACSDSRRALNEINPVRLRPALSPNVAAARSGVKIDLDDIFRAYAALGAGGQTVIVEGAGGLMCPITDDFWMIHLAGLMGLPVLIVARPVLGTINHTLLTLHAARSAGLTVAGVVINRYMLEPATQEKLRQSTGSHAASSAQPAGAPPHVGRSSHEHPDADIAMFTNPDQIEKLGKVKVLALVPDEAANEVDHQTIGPDTQFTIDQVDWEKLMSR